MDHIIFIKPSTHSLCLKEAHSSREYNRNRPFLTCRYLADTTSEISHNYSCLQHASQEPSIKRAQLEGGVDTSRPTAHTTN